MSTNEPLLVVRDLVIVHHSVGRSTRAVDGVSFTLERGESLAIVGPSGSGKSTLALSIPRLLDPRTSGIERGEIRFDGCDLLHADEASLRALRGREIGFVFQDPLAALDPVLSVGAQVLEAAGSMEQALASMRRAGLADLERLFRLHPHQLSGGMRQRVLLACAVAGGPRLLIADEPTSALDPLLARDLVAWLTAYVREEGLALLFVTHDVELAQAHMQRVLWLEGGREVERAHAPRPSRPLRASVSQSTTLLRVRDLCVRYPRRGAASIKALEHVSFELGAGEALCVIGASGSGKSTLVRALLGLCQTEAGLVEFRAPRLAMQAVFQDPWSSLNPRWSVGSALCEALWVHRIVPRGAELARARELLVEVGLEAHMTTRFPHELSGGERARVALARALAVQPRLVLLDEALSSLDPTTQTDVLRLLSQRSDLASLLVTHDLELARQASTRLLVLDAGRIVESGATEELLARPAHPATIALVEARAQLVARRPSSSGTR